MASEVHALRLSDAESSRNVLCMDISLIVRRRGVALSAAIFVACALVACGNGKLISGELADASPAADADDSEIDAGASVDAFVAMDATRASMDAADADFDATTSDAGFDAGSDAARDADIDATIDAGTAVDSGSDAGPMPIELVAYVGALLEVDLNSLAGGSTSSSTPSANARGNLSLDPSAPAGIHIAQYRQFTANSVQGTQPSSGPHIRNFSDDELLALSPVTEEVRTLDWVPARDQVGDFTFNISFSATGDACDSTHACVVQPYHVHVVMPAHVIDLEAGFCDDGSASCAPSHFFQMSTTASGDQNRTALLAGLERARTLGSGALLLPSGTLPLALPSASSASELVAIDVNHVALIGHGEAATTLSCQGNHFCFHLKQGRLADATITTLTDVVFAGLTIDGGSAPLGCVSVDASCWDVNNKAIAAFDADRSENIVLDRVKVTNFKGELLYSGGPGLRGVTVLGSTFDGSNGSAISTGSSMRMIDSAIQNAFNCIESYLANVPDENFYATAIVLGTTCEPRKSIPLNAGLVSLYPDASDRMLRAHFQGNGEGFWNGFVFLNDNGSRIVLNGNTIIDADLAMFHHGSLHNAIVANNVINNPYVAFQLDTASVWSGYYLGLGKPMLRRAMNNWFLNNHIRWTSAVTSPSPAPLSINGHVGDAVAAKGVFINFPPAETRQRNATGVHACVNHGSDPSTACSAVGVSGATAPYGEQVTLRDTIFDSNEFLDPNNVVQHAYYKEQATGGWEVCEGSRFSRNTFRGFLQFFASGDSIADVFHQRERWENNTYEWQYAILPNQFSPQRMHQMYGDANGVFGDPINCTATRPGASSNIGVKCGGIRPYTDLTYVTLYDHQPTYHLAMGTVDNGGPRYPNGFHTELLFSFEDAAQTIRVYFPDSRRPSATTTATSLPWLNFLSTPPAGSNVLAGATSTKWAEEVTITATGNLTSSPGFLPYGATGSVYQCRLPVTYHQTLIAGAAQMWWQLDDGPTLAGNRCVTTVRDLVP